VNPPRRPTPVASGQTHTQLVPWYGINFACQSVNGREPALRPCGAQFLAGFSETFHNYGPPQAGPPGILKTSCDAFRALLTHEIHPLRRPRQRRTASLSRSPRPFAKPHTFASEREWQSKRRPPVPTMREMRA